MSQHDDGRSGSGKTGSPIRSGQNRRQMTRREMLQWAALTGGTLAAGGLLQACGGTETPSASKQEEPKGSTTLTHKKGGTLRVALYDDVSTMDPFAVGTNPPAFTIRRQTSECLLTMGDNLELIPMLADSYTTSADGKTVVFKLRPGVKFHNGADMTAEDVKWSLDRHRTLSSRKGEYATIDTITTPDPLTVQLNLKRLDPTLVPALAMQYAAIFNKEAGEANSKNDGAITRPVGTGPFEFVSFTPNRETRIKRFEGYKPRPEPTNGMGGRKEAYVDEVIFVAMPDAEVRMLAIESGQIDYIEQVGPKDVERLKRNKNVTAAVQEGTDWGCLYFNVTHPLFKKVEARRAIAHAINWDEFVKGVFWGYGAVNHSLIPPLQAVWRTPEHERVHKYDPELAKSLLKQAGYNGEELKWMTRNDYRSEKTSQIFQEMFRKVGINLKLDVMEQGIFTDTIYARRNNKNPEWPFAATTSSGFRPDPHQHYGLRVHSSQHSGMYKNPAFDALVDEAASITDFEKRKSLYSQAQKIVMDDVPIIVLYLAPFINAYNNRLQGVVEKDVFSPFLWNVSIK